MIHDIITGIPRSGTTLLLRILANAHPGRMALGEPEDLLKRLHTRAFERSEFAAEIHAYCQERLAMAGRKGSYLDRRLQNLEVPDNYHGESAATLDYRRVPTPPGGFTSVICKHNDVFIPLAADIAAHSGLRLLRVLRHPAGALPSWSRWEIPVREGTSPHALLWSHKLARRIGAAGGLAERQAILYGYFLRKLAAPGLTRQSGLLLYEDLLRGAKLPPPHEHCPIEPFLKPAGNTPQLSPQETAGFLKTLRCVDEPAADLLQQIYSSSPAGNGER